jgi:hypothetical protein
MIDQNPLSRTAGCGDRAFWHYQDGKGFAVGSFQVAMLGLWYAAELFPESRERFRAAAVLAKQWWAREVIRRGALDEYFSNQKSFCATAYTTMAGSVITHFEARAGVQSSMESKEALAAALKWLRSQSSARPESANQGFAAALAWDLSHELGIQRDGGGENPFLPSPRPEGWFSEYGGFDLSYSLKCVDLCALALLVLNERPRRQRYEQAVRTLLDFLYEVVVVFTFSPALSSRGNPHRLLGGLKVFSTGQDPCAAEILAALQNEKRFPSLVPAEACDDKYLAFFHLTSLMLACHSESAPPVRIAPASRITVKRELHLKDAGLYFLRTQKSRCAISGSTGGAACVEASDGAVFSWPRYVALQNGNWYVPAPGEIQAAGNGKPATVELLVRSEPQRGALLQNPIFRLLLRYGLILPVIGSLLRHKINKTTSAKTGASVHIGYRRITVRDEIISIADELETGKFEFYKTNDWSFVDGHATRMFWRGKDPVLVK